MQAKDRKIHNLLTSDKGYRLKCKHTETQLFDTALRLVKEIEQGKENKKHHIDECERMRYEIKDGENVYNTQLVQDRERTILIEKEREEERSMNQSLTSDWNEYKREDERLQGRLTEVLQKRTLDKRRNKEEIYTLTYILGATTLKCLSQQKDMRQTIQS